MLLVKLSDSVDRFEFGVDVTEEAPGAGVEAEEAPVVGVAVGLESGVCPVLVWLAPVESACAVLGWVAEVDAGAVAVALVGWVTADELGAAATTVD